jgi:hypothetical protein
MGYAMRLIGRYLVQLTVRWYDRKKIERILGADMPFGKELGMLTQAEEQIKMQIGQEIDKSANMTPSSSEEQADQLIQNEQFRRQAEMQLTDIAQRRKILTEEQELFWQRFEAIKDTMKYDIDVEEGANSPTYRFAALAQLQAMAQSGAQIPPEVYIELADIPKSVKEKLMASIQAQAQAAQQAQQMEMEMRQQKYQVDQMKAMAGMSGKINANGVQGQDAGSGGSPFDAPVA